MVTAVIVTMIILDHIRVCMRMSPIGSCVCIFDPPFGGVWVGRLKRYGLIGGSMTLEIGFEGLKPHAFSSRFLSACAGF